MERGFAKARAKGEQKSRADFEISYPCFVVTGRDEKELAAAQTATSRQIAFYGSTPAYKPVLESIGAGDLQPKLNAMSKQGRWCTAFATTACATAVRLARPTTQPSRWAYNKIETNLLLAVGPNRCGSGGLDCEPEPSPCSPLP